MYNVRQNVQASLGHFRMDNYWFRYSNFVPRLYNWCLKLGFEEGKIMPSRAFCSDESQGYPVILLAKHFGTFPFNHGKVGGILAEDRHAPHAHHGEDLVIVHASHVGYNPDTHKYGAYKRCQTEHHAFSSSCGKIQAALQWFLNEYEYAQNNIFIEVKSDQCLITIDNQYLSLSRKETLVLDLEKIIDHHIDGKMIPVSMQSTSRTFVANHLFAERMRWFFDKSDGRVPIGEALTPEYFSFHCNMKEDPEGARQLERNLVGAMPWIVSSTEPMLTAAQANTQAEFDRSYRNISQEPAYSGRNLLYVSGLHVDISPRDTERFMLTKFIPWAAFVQKKTGESYVLNQDELFEALNSCSTDNPNQIDLDEAIQNMESSAPVSLHLPY